MSLQRPPRVAAIHDLSCFGRCALTVVIPVLSAMGVQVIPLPTALLSTHTGGFDGLYFRDLTGDMKEIESHFGRLGLEFDAIYSGFLGSAEQLGIVSGFIDRHGGGIPVLVDPVMGDDGSLYSTYTDELVRGMKGICAKADIITPNITEAHFLTGIPLPESVSNEAAASELAGLLCAGLHELTGVERVVITGIRFGDRVGNAFSDGGICNIYSTPRLARSFPGTGEVFSSVLLGGILRGDTTAGAVRRATDFTYHVIGISQSAREPERDGVWLEKCLGELIPPG